MPADEGEPVVPPPAVTLTTRTVVKIFFTLVGLSALVYVLYLVRSVVILVFIAGFLAVALGPAVDALGRRGVPRAGSILPGFGPTLLLVGLFVLSCGGLRAAVAGCSASARQPDVPPVRRPLRPQRQADGAGPVAAVAPR